MLDTQMLYDSTVFWDEASVYNGQHLEGKSPYLFYRTHPHPFVYGTTRCYYFSSNSLAERSTYMRNGNWLLTRMQKNDLLVDYSGESTQKDYLNLFSLYDRMQFEQIKDLVASLDFKKVKLEQQDQFFIGLRMMNRPLTALVGFQICLDAYEFEGWEFDWANPISYFNVVKNVVGLVLPLSSLARG